VFVECCRLGIPWQGIIHDWSKFLPSEWFPYVAYFYGESAKSYADYMAAVPTQDEVDAAFDWAWLLHQKRNPHHWQWWVLQEDAAKNRYAVQAHQPEFGPYFLWDDSHQKHVAMFGFGYGCENPPMDTPEYSDLYRISEDIKDTLNRAPKALPMPDRYRREMLADWKGAGLAMGKPNTREWYLANRQKMILHPDTRAWVEKQLGVKGA
jgi:hypothetical protein